MHFSSYYTDKLVLLSLLLFLGSLPLLGQRRVLQHEDQQWAQYYASIRLSDQIAILPDAGLRWEQGMSELNKYIARVGVNYKYNPRWSFLAGLAHLGAFEEGRINQLEFRSYQEAVLRGLLASVNWSQRLRLEQRFFAYPGSDPIPQPDRFHLRIRYRIVTNIPFSESQEQVGKHPISLILGNEVFFHLGNRDANNPLALNRFILGPRIVLKKDLAVGLLYNLQFTPATRLESQTLGHIFWLVFKHTIDKS
ncbi:MAG: DUF2490 domain-containing protein [Bacteroidota bacterium]